MEETSEKAAEEDPSSPGQNRTRSLSDLVLFCPGYIYIHTHTHNFLQNAVSEESKQRMLDPPCQTLSGSLKHT